MAKANNVDMSLLQNQPGVPYGGWHWHWMFDYGQNYVKCQYCGQYPVRFLHILKHEHYPDFIHVGSDCAAHLCNRPYEEMKKLETDFKRYCAARDKFLKETNWTVNAHGNLVAKYVRRGSPDKTLTIVQSNQNTIAVACNSKYAYTMRSDDFVNIIPITTIEQAKKVAFDLAYNAVCEWNLVVWNQVRKL